jgi:KDO2-lipid IV(A) lauroyltransferase
MVRHLKKNGMVAILADEPYNTNPVHVPFFGKISAAPRGPALLHLRYGSPVVFAFPVRQADGRYKATLDGPHIFPKSGAEEQDCVRFTTWVNQVFESVIRKYPEQWFLLPTPRWPG